VPACSDRNVELALQIRRPASSPRFLFSFCSLLIIYVRCSFLHRGSQEDRRLAAGRSEMERVNRSLCLENLLMMQENERLRGGRRSSWTRRTRPSSPSSSSASSSSTRAASPLPVRVPVPAAAATLSLPPLPPKGEGGRQAAQVPPLLAHACMQEDLDGVIMFQTKLYVCV
jgi:hypothetical protein